MQHSGHKDTMTSFDLAAIVLELKDLIKGAKIDKIHQIANRSMLFRLRDPKQDLVIEAGKRIHLTKYVTKKPPFPSPFCRSLRKHVQDGVVGDVWQHDFERVVVIEVLKGDDRFKLVFEIFKDGNIILLDKEENILQALTYRRMRDRNIIRGERYRYPPQMRLDPVKITRQQFEGLKEQNVETVRALTALCGIGGLYAEEVLKKAGVDKTEPASALTDVQIEKIHESTAQLLSFLKTREIHPRIVIDKNGEWIDVLPFAITMYEGYSAKDYPSFNEAADEYFTRMATKTEEQTVSEDIERQIQRQRRILEQQEAKMKELEKSSEEDRVIGDLIFAHLNELEYLFNWILTQRRSGIDWEAISSKLKKGEAGEGIPPGLVELIDPKRGGIVVKMDDVKASLSFQITPQENAARFYSRSKKAREKMRGAQEAVSKAREELENIRKHVKTAAKLVREPLRMRERAWYEKFHWFFSSEGMLVLGGRDAGTNELLIKRHMEAEDVVLHADVQGAPFVLIKTQKKAPSEGTLLEAAQLAASYSKAWQTGFGSADVYWVRPSQVSKEAPSGEYLAKGAFMIRGERNYLRKVPLQVSIGIMDQNNTPVVIGGPTSAIASKTKNYVRIVPGNKPSKKLAEEIKTRLVKASPKRAKGQIERLTVEEIQSFIPAGKGDLLNS